MANQINYIEVGEMVSFNLKNAFYLMHRDDMTFPETAYAAKMFARQALEQENKSNKIIVSYNDAMNIITKNMESLYKDPMNYID